MFASLLGGCSGVSYRPAPAHAAEEATSQPYVVLVGIDKYGRSNLAAAARRADVKRA